MCAGLVGFEVYSCVIKFTDENDFLLNFVRKFLRISFEKAERMEKHLTHGENCKRKVCARPVEERGAE